MAKSKTTKAPAAGDRPATPAIPAQALAAETAAAVTPPLDGGSPLPPPAQAQTADRAADRATDGAVLLQDWTPLGQSLDVRIGRAAWPSEAPRLFADEAVPHVAHDSGALSARHARVIAAWLEARATAGTLPERVVLVEAGIGTGLHLRYLLRHLRRLGADRPWADRLEVWATDVSPAMLLRTRERRLFEGMGPVHLALLDVAAPSRLLPLDDAGGAGSVRDLTGAIHIWIANYVLDLLPADLFRRVRAGGATRWQAVLARTWLQQPEALDAFADLDLDGVRAAVAEGTPAAMARLAPAWSLFEPEIRAFDIGPTAAGLPEPALLAAVADGIDAALGAAHAALAEGTVAHHSGGALLALERVGAALADGGIALVRDLGATTAAEAAVPRGAAHYGPTVATGLSFYELDLAFAEGRAGCRLHRPAVDGPRAQASRLLARGDLAGGVADAVLAVFAEALDGRVLAAAEQRRQRAQAEPAPLAAIDGYRALLREEPENWFLLQEAGRVALERAGNPQLAAMLAREALRINGESSADLWRLLGDAMWALGERRLARGAFAEALTIRPRDARAHYGAAFVDAERGRFASALEHIGQALAHDTDGSLRPRVLQLLDAALRGQDAARAAAAQRLATRGER